MTHTKIDVLPAKTTPCTKTQQLYTLKDDFISGCSRYKAVTDPIPNQCNEGASAVDLALISGFNLSVEPLGRFVEGGNMMRFSLPNAGHRDHQENQGCEFKQQTAKGAIGD